MAEQNTDTVLLPVSATCYTRVPSGLATTPAGLLPVCAVKVTGAALVINAALVTSGTVWLVDIAASPDVEASPTTVCWLSLVATVSMAWLVSVGLTGRLRLSSAPACPNWRRARAHGQQRQAQRRVDRCRGPLVASGPKPAAASRPNTIPLTSGRGGVGSAGAAEIAWRATTPVCGTEQGARCRRRDGRQRGGLTHRDIDERACKP